MINKKNFLLHDYIPLLQQLIPEANGVWGLMNPHQMVEHMMYSFQLANGKLKVESLLSAEESIPKLQAWLLSSKPMKENINNPLISNTPPDPIFEKYSQSLDALYQEIRDMYNLFEKDSELKILNPFYGDLDCNHYTNLLYKHALHHLRQFGVIVEYIEG